MEESGWGDGPNTGPSASGDPHDKENDELIEEDDAMEDEEDEDDDESDEDEEEEEDASEEGHQRARKKRGKRSRREKISKKAMQANEGQGSAYETSCNLSLAVGGNSSRRVVWSKINYKVLKENYDPAHPTDELEEMAVVDFPIPDTPKEDEYDPAHPTDELEEKEAKETVNSVEDQFGIDQKEKCEPEEFHSHGEMHKEKGDRSSVEDQFSVDNKGRQKVEKAYLSATEEMHDDRLERDSFGEVKCERPKGESIEVSNEKDSWMQNTLVGEKIKVRDDSCINYIDGQKGAPKNVEHVAEMDPGENTFHMEEYRDLDSSFVVVKGLVNDLTEGNQADRSSLNTSLDASFNTTLDTFHNSEYNGSALTELEEEEDIAEEEENKDEIVDSAVDSETVKLLGDVAVRSLEEMDDESVEDKQEFENKSKKFEQENETERPHSSHEEEYPEEMEVLYKSLLSKETEVENDKGKRYKDLEGNYNEHKMKTVIASGHNFNADCSEELEENKDDTEDEGDKEREFKDVQSKNYDDKDEISAESTSSYESSEDPVQKKVQKDKGIVFEDSDDLAVSGSEAQDRKARFEQDKSGSYQERNDDTPGGEEEEDEEMTDEMDNSDKSKDEIYNLGSRYKERGEDYNSKEIRKNYTKDITVEDENEEGELPKDSIDSPDEEKVRDDEYSEYRIRRKVELKEKEKVRRQNEPKVRKSENKNSVSKGKHKKISDKGKKLKKKVEDEEGEDGELHEKTEPSVKFNVIKHKKSGKDVNKSQRKYRHYRRSNSTRDDIDFEEHEKHEIAERIVYEKNDSHSLRSKETKKKENKGSERNISRKQDRDRGEREKYFQHGEEGEWDNGEIEEGEFVEKTDYYKGDYYSRGNESLIDDYFTKFKEKNYYSKEKEKLKEDSYVKGKEKAKEDYHLKDKQRVKADHSSKGMEREKRKKSHKKEKVEQLPKPQPAKPQSAKHQLPPPSSKIENKVEEDSDDDVQIVYVELSPWAHIPKMVQPKPNKKTTDSKQSRLMIKVSQNNEDRTVWKEKQKTKEKESGRDHGRGDRDKDRRRERGRDADRRSQRHRTHSRNRGSRSKDRSRRSRSRDRSKRRRNERSRSRSTNHSSHDRSYKRQRRNRSRDLSLSRERDLTRDRWSRERERSLDQWSPDRYRQRWSRDRLSGERSRERWSRGRSLERWSLERDTSMGRLSRERDTSLERYKSPEILFDRRDLYGEEMKSPSPFRLLKEVKPSKKKGKEKQKEKEVVPIIVESESPVKVKKKKKIPKGEKKALAKKRKVEVIESPELPELPPELSPEKEDEIEFAVEEPVQQEDIEMNEKITMLTPEDLDLSDDSNDRLVIATEPEPEESGPEENEEEISDDERINRIENMQFRDPREGKSTPLMTRSKDYDPAHPTVSPIFDEGPDEDKVETRQGRIEPRLGKHPLPASGDAFTVKPFPPPPPPLPPLNTVVSQAAITTQVPISGPPGHGLMGQGPPLLPIPTSGASGVPHPLGLSVPPPGLQPGLPGPPPPRPLMAPPFMNRPPPSHLPPISEPVAQVRWPVSAPPGIVGQFRSRMAGDVGPPPPGLYDDLPPETTPSMPLPVDPAHSVAISVAQTVASTILPQPIPIPDSHPQGPPPQPVHHLSPHESLPLSNHEDLHHLQPHNVQTKPPVSLSTVVTSVSGTSPHTAIPRPMPSGEVIPGIGQISNLLAPAQLAIFGASEGTGKRIEHRDALNETGLFKVPLPPSSLAKVTDGATKPFDKVETSEVVDMDISSPSEDECSIELPSSPKARKSHSKSKEKRDSKRREKRDSKKGAVSERKELKTKSKEPVVDVDSSSSLKESFAAVIDTIFLQDSEESEKVEGLKESKKLRSHHKHRHRRHKDKKEINPQEMAVSDTQNELIEQVDEPSSAVDLTNKEKYLRKLHLQERVVDELKLALKPHYASKNIDKEQYKDILRKAVPKVCKSKDVNPAKIRKLVDAYVEKYQKTKKREGKITFGKSPQEKLTPNGNRPLNLTL